MPKNRAAYQPSKKAVSFTVSDAPYPSPSADQVVIRTAAVAVNPIDWLIQSRGDLMYTHIKYPFVLGYDAAGEVVSVGNSVTRFQIGDRVLGLCRGADEPVNSSAESAFQNYVALPEDLTAPITRPDISFAQASVLPLGLTTAAAALFDKAQLVLDLPTVPPRSPNGKTVIVWGGSTSVGCCAVQLAVAAGYEVLSTASPRNHDLLRKLGAANVWDYRSPDVVDDIVAALKGKTVAGAVSIGGGAAEKCMQILEKAATGRKFVAMATFPMPDKEPRNLVMLRTGLHFAGWTIAYKAKGVMNGVGSAFVNLAPVFTNGIAKYIFADFLPKALAAGNFVPAPDPEVVGHGLESIQDAFAVQKNGVSAKKIVVTLMIAVVCSINV